MSSRTLSTDALAWDVDIATYTPSGSSIPNAMVVWSERGSSRSTYQTRYAHLWRFSGATRRGRISRRTTPRDTGSPVSRIALSASGSTDFLTFVGTLADPLGHTGAIWSYQMFTDGATTQVFSIGTNLRLNRHEGLASTYAPAVVYYDPYGDDNGIESRWANCH